jgi:KUP system potassium uptake protein
VFVSPPARVEGTAVFLTAEPGTVPNALLHNLKHNKVLHEQQPVRHGAQPRGAVDRPGQAPGDRVAGPPLLAGHGPLRLQERPGPAPSAGADPGTRLRTRGHDNSYFLSRDTVIPTIGSGMAPWREKLFAQMHHNASGAADFLKLPNNSVVELGSKIEI